MTEHPQGVPSLRLVRVHEALSDAWPDVSFHVEHGEEWLSLAWTDGPGRRAVLNEARTSGWGTAPVRATRSLTPEAMLAMLRSGVTPRELPNAPALTTATTRTLPYRLPLQDTQRIMVALCRLRDDELDIAVTLASDDPSRPLPEIVRAARALAAGDRMPKP